MLSDESRRPARVPEALVSMAGYFLPRLMFLQSSHAACVHWGDVTRALHQFPLEPGMDLRSPELWARWMERWAKLGESYVAEADASSTPAGKRRMNRSAAGCFHAAEFMYFEDVGVKTALRRRAKQCFEASLDTAALHVERGEVSWEGIAIPYYLVLPPGVQGPVPCVVLSNGLDSMTECEIFAFAEQFVARGMAALLFDGPGQGIHVGVHPIDLRIERLAGELLALLVRDPRIDQDRLAFFGISFGGHLALRVATRIGSLFRCVVNLGGGPSFGAYETLPRRLKADFDYAFRWGPGEGGQEAFDAMALPLATPSATDVLSLHGALDDIFPLAKLEAWAAGLGPRHTLRVFESEAHVCLNYINSYATFVADWVAARCGRRS